MLADIALDAFEGLARSGKPGLRSGALRCEDLLATVAKTATSEEVALRALAALARSRSRIDRRHARLEPIRLAALAALQDPGEILSVALNSDFKGHGHRRG